MSTTTNIEEMSEGAQFLYEHALAKGRQQGKEAQSHESAEWTSRSHLDLAYRMLITAISSGNDEVTRWLAQYSNMLLSRTPAIYVDRPLMLLRREDWIYRVEKAPNRDALKLVANEVEIKLEALGGYPY